MTTTPPEPFVPSSKEDWATAFADGIALDRSRREEAEAKAKAAATASGTATGGSGDNGDTRPKPTWAERILGSIH